MKFNPMVLRSNLKLRLEKVVVSTRVFPYDSAESDAIRQLRVSGLSSLIVDVVFDELAERFYLMGKIVKLSKKALGFVEYLAEATDADEEEEILAKDLAKVLKEWKKFK